MIPSRIFYVAGLSNMKPCVIIYINRQPGANIVATVDKLLAILPLVACGILPPSMSLVIEHDRTQTIHASINEIQRTLLITVALVVMVIFVFLRNFWSTLIPAVAVPVSLLGTFGVLYLSGYSLDNLSLIALTVATGFVVDDAIVVIENVSRHLEHGSSPIEAALKGSREIGFTVLSMSISLTAVFIPILLMGGIVGRLFREFAVALSVAVAISLLVSLTATPMMCAKFLRPVRKEGHNWLYRANERVFDKLQSTYERGLRWVLRRQPLTLGVTIALVCLSGLLYYYIPKGFFPQQDTLAITGSVQAAQDVSFESMKEKETQYSKIMLSDPAITDVTAYVGGGAINTGRLIALLAPVNQASECR